MGATVITSPKVDIAPDLLAQLKTQTEESGQVILHFLHFNISPVTSFIRIWPSTYLIPHDSDHKSELVHFENITLYPQWRPVEAMTKDYFTLVFSGLPKSCTIFDFEEHCTNEAGAFIVRNIERNEQDVYYLQMIG